MPHREHQREAGPGHRPRRVAAAGFACALAAGSLVLLGTGNVSARAVTCFGVPATLVVTTPGATTDGTPGNDVIVGTPGPDTIHGQGGDDLICGLAGDDVLIGGLGNDQIDGSAGADQLRGDSFSPTGNATGGGTHRLLGGDCAENYSGD
ncbi:calcium-binding protein, partial [Streptomyces sp. NPDC059742]|uniref:calcium-binding protein n=1 Tax=Streptomyces sp. NPDC059742 TaxID=3346927 RepID=UPI003656CA96